MACRYSELESQHLQADLDTISFPTSSASPEDVVEGMKVSVPLAFQLFIAAIDRCVRLTQGTEVQAVVHVIDMALRDIVTKFKVTLSSFRLLQPELNDVFVHSP